MVLTLPHWLSTWTRGITSPQNHEEIEDPNPLTEFLKLEDERNTTTSYCFVVEKFIKQEKKISKRKY